MPGLLYLVATPIGNYEDMTHRALRILRDADVIVCEEVREGMRLLRHFDIGNKNLEVLNEHNEREASAAILAMLREGKTVALISDSGTPVFADPGHLLVRKAIEHGIGVIPVPGASSLVAALAVSGFSISKFLYYGWLSPKRSRRISELRQLKKEKRVIVLLDTPYRLVPLLRDMADVFGDSREICIAFNLTMPNEQIFRGTAPELYNIASEKNLKGEFVIVVGEMGR